MGVSSILFCVESTMTNGWPDALVEHYRAERLSLVRLAALVLGSKELAEAAVQDAVVAVRTRPPNSTGGSRSRSLGHTSVSTATR